MLLFLKSFFRVLRVEIKSCMNSFEDLLRRSRVWAQSTVGVDLLFS